MTIYADFESILVPEDNGKQDPEEPWTKNIKNMLLAFIAIIIIIIIIIITIMRIIINSAPKIYNGSYAWERKNK